MTHTLTPTPTEPPDLGIAFLPSHCVECLAAGCSYVEAATVEHALRWPGGAAPVTAAYECSRCGHEWSEDWAVRPWLFADDETPKSPR
ncbi:hypothetical protein AB0H20_12565 [Nocardia fluminea]|uniref:hypothetical protein n=1 Tax=Nocardia fluminea TaxID=134984 RepID=UPI0033F24246